MEARRFGPRPGFPGFRVHYVHPRPAWLVLTTYAVGGALIAAALPALKAWSATQYGRPGYAVALVINVLMPLLIVLLASAYPRVWVAGVGALGAGVNFLLCSGVLPRVADPIGSFIVQAGPIATAALAGYILIAALVSWSLRHWRVVGLRPAPDACENCGYPVRGAARCPECGAPTSSPPANTRNCSSTGPN